MVPGFNTEFAQLLHKEARIGFGSEQNFPNGSIGDRVPKIETELQARGKVNQSESTAGP
jgi:hypothetical protein